MTDFLNATPPPTASYPYVKPKAVKRVVRDLLANYEKKHKMEKLCILLISDVCNEVLDHVLRRAILCMKHAKHNKLTVGDVMLPYDMDNK
jgi:histone H3/H4